MRGTAVYDDELTPVAVCIPVRDEAADLPALLDGLERQTGCRRDRISLCFFFDGCTDGGRALVRRHAAGSSFVILDEGGAGGAPPNAGRARRAAMKLGLRALDGTDGLLLTTDADSVPATDWIACSCDALRRAEIVAGRIVRRPPQRSPLQDRIEAYYDRLYALRRRIDPIPWDGPATHHFTGGANLGFRAAAYRQLGGFLPLPFGEDARIVDDAARLGLRVRRDPASVVRTSSRRIGRAAGGLAASLRQLDRDDRPLLVGHPDDMAWQYRMHARARAGFARASISELAALLALPIDHLAGVARDCANGEAFAMRIVPVPPGGIREVTLDRAELALGSLEARQLEAAS